MRLVTTTWSVGGLPQLPTCFKPFSSAAVPQRRIYDRQDHYVFRALELGLEFGHSGQPDSAWAGLSIPQYRSLNEPTGIHSASVPMYLIDCQIGATQRRLCRTPRSCRQFLPLMALNNLWTAVAD